MRVKVEGLRDLERSLAGLKPSVAKSTLRRSLKKSAAPLAEQMRARAPRQDAATEHMADSIAVSPRLSKRQARLHRRMFRDDRAAVEMFVGPGPFSAATQQEFGNMRHGPQPFARPAWDADKMAMLKRLSETLRREIDATVRRAAKRAAKAKAKG